MKRTIRTLSLFLAFILTLTFVFTACNVNNGAGDATTDGNSSSTDEPYVPDENEYQLEKIDGYNQLTFYWSHGGTYENCDIWIWWGDVAGKGYTFHECSYGAKVVVNVPEGITEVGFIVRKIIQNFIINTSYLTFVHGNSNKQSNDTLCS